MRTIKLRSKLSLLFIALAALIAIPAAVALADNIQDNITDNVASALQLTKGDATSNKTAEVRIIGNNSQQDPDTGCNFDTATESLTLKFNTPTGVTATAVDGATATAGQMKFTECGVDQTVGFSAGSTATAGDYTVTADVVTNGTNGTFTNQLSIPIRVNAPAATETSVSQPSATTSTYGGTTNLSATVSPAGAPGSVDFFVNGSSTAVPATYNATTGVATVTDYTHGLNASTTPYSVKAAFTPSSTSYKGSEATNSTALTVNKAALTVTADNASRAYNAEDPAFTATYSGFVNGETNSVLGGTLAFATDATASSPVGDNYTITPSGLTSNNYNISFVDGTLEITKANQTITFADPPDKTYGDAPFTVSASSGSGLPVSIAASGQCTISGNTVTITGAGTCTLTASQAGNSNYNAATNVVNTVDIAKASQTITFADPPDKTYGDADFEVSATGGDSGNPVTFAASGKCSVSGSTVTITGAGTCTLTASQAGNSNYNAATNVVNTVDIAKASQTITFADPPDKTFDNGTFSLNATASSGLGVTYTSSTPSVCTVVGSTVTIRSKGDCTITAQQAGNDNYNAAPNVQQTVAIAGWGLKGFYQPVDMGDVINGAKAGSTVPLKFEVFDNSGVELTNTSVVTSFVQKVTCGALSGTEDAIENYSTGSTSLRYDTTAGQFIFNWQTPKAASSCYKVTLTTTDGSTLTANFRLK